MELMCDKWPVVLIDKSWMEYREKVTEQVSIEINFWVEIFFKKISPFWLLLDFIMG